MEENAKEIQKVKGRADEFLAAKQEKIKRKKTLMASVGKEANCNPMVQF